MISKWLVRTLIFENFIEFTDVLCRLKYTEFLLGKKIRNFILFYSGKSELTFEDILQILDEQWTIVHNDRDALRQALEKFDDTQEGYIEIDRFRTIMSTLGEPLTDEELDAFIQLGLNDDQTKINIDCKI